MKDFLDLIITSDAINLLKEKHITHFSSYKRQVSFLINETLPQISTLPYTVAATALLGLLWTLVYCLVVNSIKTDIADLMALPY